MFGRIMSKARRRKAARRRARYPGASVSVVFGDLPGGVTAADAAAEAVAVDRDRARFASDPELSAYQRLPWPGELRAAIQPGFDLAAVVVSQVRPGVRVRVPVFRPLRPSEIN
jgi:hypothetical protein